MRAGVLVIAALVAGCTAIPHMMFGRRSTGFILYEEYDQKAMVRAENSNFGYINQKIDHFNDSDTRTFPQRYFFNNIGGGTVNFLYIEGEQTASDGMIVKSPVMLNYAKKFNANLYMLEHRFYGASRPFDTISDASLVYLTSQQALADLAEFIKQVNAKTTTPQKWVVFGGSYAGALSLWFRQMYPEVTLGAVGTSGPILAQLDFYGYMQKVEDAIKEYDTLNGAQCAAQIAIAMDAIEKNMLSMAGRDVLDVKFNMDPKLSSYAPLTENIISLFYQNAVSMWMDGAQYGGLSNHTIKTVPELCDQMVAPGGDPLDKFATIAKTATSDGKLNADYQQMVDQLRDTNWGKNETSGSDSNSRSWIWQTCNEFGYYQTTDMGTNMFRATIPSSQSINLCKDVFGIDTQKLKANIDATNAYYGERNYYSGTNVVISYGKTDPWGYLAKHDSQHESVIVQGIKGGIHCQDFYLPDALGAFNSDVNKTQALAFENIEKWLQGYDDVPNNVTITDKVGQRPSVFDLFHSSPIAVNNNTVPIAAALVQQLDLSQASVLRRNVFTGRPSDGFMQPPVAKEKNTWPPNVHEATMTQPWDHFDNTNPNVFKQRYFANEKFGTKNGPNFIMIGGEGPESDRWVLDEKLAWMTYAKEVNANVFLLEHRYYGKTNDLQYLTSAQMLHDVAAFIRFAKKERGATGPWISFGGSYSGALSAWAREWFPELIAGAVASSGPVEAKNDFYEYLMVVEKVLKSVNVNCSARVQEAFTKMRDLVRNPEGRKQLSDTFKLYPAWNNDANQPILASDIHEFFGQMYGAFQGVVQYSKDNNGNGIKYTADDLCSIMQNMSYVDSLDAVRAVQVWQADGDVNTTTLTSYATDIASLQDMRQYIDGKNPNSPYSDGNLASILWTWQTCNEFGYFQTTDYGSGIFGNPVPLNFYVRMCEDVFGTGMQRLEDGISRTIYQYGGRYRFKGTNVVLPNGRSDPWHALGILEQGKLDKSVVPIPIEGTAHCADMYEYRDEDPQQLKDARVKILDNIKAWLNFTPPPSTVDPTATAATNPTIAPSTQSGSTTFSSAIVVATLLFAAFF